MSGPPRPRRGRRPSRLASALAVSAAVLVGIVACSSSSGGRSAATTTAPAPTTTARPQSYEGDTDGFYEVPHPLPPGKPGQLIRVEDLSTENDLRTVRVMYHSRDSTGADRAVTGVISYPTLPPPVGGWPVLSYAHGTTGMSTTCAPSRVGMRAPDYGIFGVVVGTDYIGLGPVGERHSYLSGVDEAHSVIDGVRAARNLQEAHAGTRWVAVGVSQGGHAAIFANQLAVAYAPDLQLLASVAVAPAGELTTTFGPSDELTMRVARAMALYGAQREHPAIDPHDYVGPAVDAVDGVIDRGCAIASAFKAVPADRFFRRDPAVTEPARGYLLANDPGHASAPSPLLQVYGTADTTIVPERAGRIVERICATGQVSEVVWVDGADHGSIYLKSWPQVHDWVDARFAGRPVGDSCPVLP